VSTRNGDPGDDSSDESIDDEDTGETSGQDSDFERKERTSKKGKGEKVKVKESTGYHT